MPVKRPSKADFLLAAEDHGYHLSDSQLESFLNLADETLGSYDAIDTLYAQTLAQQPPARTFSKAADADNRHGAWYVKTTIAGAAQGPLAGKTVVIKDNVSVAGVPLANGSLSLDGYIPAEDATVVKRLLAAGATVVGKSVCEDLCFSGASFTAASGPVKNPWDLTRNAGGSSSGSAVLVALGEVDMAIGGDQGGSIRMPSAWSGIVGHKPTYGLVPYTGAFPIERTIDHVGPMANSVHDVALMLDVIAGADGLDSRQKNPPAVSCMTTLDQGVAGLRVGVLREGFGILGVSEAQVDAQVKAAIAQLERLGATVGEASVPWHSGVALDIWNVVATDGAAYQMLQGNGYGMNVDGYYDPEIMSYFGAKRREHADALSSSVRAVALTGHYSLKNLHGASYAKARMLVPELTRQYDEAFKDFDVLVMPTMPFVATPLTAADAPIEEYVHSALNMLANTAPFDLTGHPATSVPTGLADGLPVAMMIVAPRFEDALALRVAHAYEQARGAFPKPPRP
ncbi:amidase [Pseudomonas oryzihabitans]|uniref:amidase n=1 Tax=Pseudomonas oryzihabitans TaxID=47885 RepID=UPI0011A1CBE7|nr:amidase [Pseudomonas psychrotolerans]